MTLIDTADVKAAITGAEMKLVRNPSDKKKRENGREKVIFLAPLTVLTQVQETSTHFDDS